MKKIYKSVKYAAVTIALMALSMGCNDFFDTQPDNNLNVESIFANREQTERWWGGLYSLVPRMWDMPYNYIYGITTDELDASNWTSPAINTGGMSSTTSTSKYASYYEKIRHATIFINNVDKNQEILALDNGANIIKQYKAEAQFLRAFYYWQLMKEIGPVPIVPFDIPDNTDIYAEMYQIPRSTWSQCISFIMSEMEAAKQNLSADYSFGGVNNPDPTQVGRINQIIVAAVQSQILLYDASPLYNGNVDFADMRNQDGTQLINQTYDGTKWQKAAIASKAAIDLAHAAGKKLYKVNNADPFKAAFLSVRNLFWDGVNDEGIWYRPSGVYYNDWERSVAPRAIQGNGYNGIAVVQSFVDDFRMADGKSISTSAQYTETTYATTNTDYYVAGTNNMYANREARFYADITFNGSVLPGIPKSGVTRVEFYNSGNSGKAGAPRDWPKTGYTARKNIHPTYSANPSVKVARPDMNIRLAELYLNYAEALNEASPGSPDVLDYLNRVRNRAGLPSLTGGSQSDLRTQIRLERRIELCYEGGHRYFDVRRWKIPDLSGSNQGGAFYGMNMNAGSALSDPDFHKRVVAFTRASWQKKSYFLPIPQNEIDRNKKLVQNPGY